MCVCVGNNAINMKASVTAAAATTTTITIITTMKIIDHKVLAAGRLPSGKQYL